MQVRIAFPQHCMVIRFALHGEQVQVLDLPCWLSMEAVASCSELNEFSDSGNLLCVHIAWLTVQNTKSI